MGDRKSEPKINIQPDIINNRQAEQNSNNASLQIPVSPTFLSSFATFLNAIPFESLLPVAFSAMLEKPETVGCGGRLKICKSVIEQLQTKEEMPDILRENFLNRLERCLILGMDKQEEANEIYLRWESQMAETIKNNVCDKWGKWKCSKKNVVPILRKINHKIIKEIVILVNDIFDF